MNDTSKKHAATAIETDFYLWHLQHLGVVTKDFATPLWDKAKISKVDVLVAIIDNGADIDHPNLAGACNRAEIIDFSSHLYGTTYDAPVPNGAQKAQGQTSAPHPFADLKSQLKGLGVKSEENKPLDSVITSLLKPKNLPVGLQLHDPSRYFASHGTACAGLVGGRPGTVADPKALAGAIAYFGVNPFCRILPICTPYSHEFLPVIHALLYAVVRGAKVILMPRGMPHIGDRSGLPGVKQHGSRIENGKGGAPLVDADQAERERLEDHRKAFEFLIAALSKKLYIVVAAGNDGFDDELSYPASLIGGTRVGDPASHHHTTAVGPGFIVVGAVNREGKPSAYSNGKKRGDILHMLSDDSVVVQDGLLRIDTKSQFAADYETKEHFGGTNPKNYYSPWGILSLDVSGPYGYASGDGEGTYEHATEWDRQSLYTIFGGTSCASALTAGMIALALQAGKLKMDPLGDTAELERLFGGWKKGTY